jgi:hypothetical protein
LNNTFQSKHRFLESDRKSNDNKWLMELTKALKEINPKFEGFPKYAILLSKGFFRVDPITQEAGFSAEIGYDFDRAGPRSKVYNFR